jgi:HEAT repeat protein
MSTPSRAVRTFLLFALLAATVACDTGPKEGEEGVYWGQKLHEGELKKREAAMQHLIELKDPASLPHLYDVMKGDVVQLKPKAAQLIGEIGDESSIDALVSGIDWNAGAGRDRKSRIAATANERIAGSLVKVAKPGNEKAAEALKRLAGSNHLNTQLAAVVGLGQLDAKTAVQDLIDIAEGHANNFMVKNAIIALGDIGDEKAVPIFIRMLFFERNVSFYREASFALFQIGKPAIAPLLDVYNGKYKAIEDLHVDANVQRAKALEVLADIGGPQVEPLILEIAAMKVDDTASALARAKAHGAIGRFGIKKAAPILMKHWDNVDVSQSEFALHSISQIGHRAAMKPLLAMSTHDGYMNQCIKKQDNPETACRFSEAQVRKVRLTALARLADGGLVDAWDKMIADADANAKEEADKAAKGEGAEKSVASKSKKGHEKTKELLIKTKPMLVAAAECGAKTECWIGKLKDENPRVREKAGYELLFSGDDAAIPALVEALGDKDNEARYAAILAVWRKLPKEAGPRSGEILKAEKGKTQFIRINEDLKRLHIKAERGY